MYVQLAENTCTVYKIHTHADTKEFHCFLQAWENNNTTNQNNKSISPCFLYTTVHVKLLILMSLGKQTVWITMQSRTLSNTVDGYINCSSKDIRIVRLSPLLLYHTFLNLSGFVYFSMTQQECMYNSYCVCWRDCAFR